MNIDNMINSFKAKESQPSMFPNQVKGAKVAAVVNGRIKEKNKLKLVELIKKLKSSNSLSKTSSALAGIDTAIRI